MICEDMLKSDAANFLSQNLCLSKTKPSIFLSSEFDLILSASLSEVIAQNKTGTQRSSMYEMNSTKISLSKVIEWKIKFCMDRYYNKQTSGYTCS